MGPTDRVYDGKDMSDVLLKDDGKSRHKVLFFYGGRSGKKGGPAAARMDCWKAHWGTAPGLGGCQIGAGVNTKCPTFIYDTEDPLLFNVCIDPSEGMPLSGVLKNSSNPGPTPLPLPQGIDDAVTKLVSAYKHELATFVHGNLVEPDLLPGERAGVRVCCDKDPFKPAPANFTCDCNGPPYLARAECTVSSPLI